MLESPVIYLCSGALHLKKAFLEVDLTVLHSDLNYDGKRKFPNSDVYTRVPSLLELTKKRLIVVQAINANGELATERWTSADRLFELLQVLDVLNHPVKVIEEQHKQFRYESLPQKIIVDVVLTCFPFGKQDHAVKTGEAVSAKIALELIARGCRRIYTIDPHPPQTFEFMADAIDQGKLVKISLISKIVNEAKKRFKLENVRVFTADEFGKVRMGLDGLGKVRTDSSTVEITGTVDVQGKEIIIVDDLMLSGGTLLKTVEKYKELGATKVIPCVIHTLPLESTGETKMRGVIQELQGKLLVTDTVGTKIFSEEYPECIVSCVPELIKALLKESSPNTKV